LRHTLQRSNNAARSATNRLTRDEARRLAVFQMTMTYVLPGSAQVDVRYAIFFVDVRTPRTVVGDQLPMALAMC